MKITFKYVALFILFLTGAFSPAWALVEIKGAGGAAEKPLAQSWASQYSEARLKYESKNSADAINQFLGKGCDFLLIDSALTPAQTKKTISRHLLCLPAALLAQTVIYNLPGIPSGALKLTPSVLSDIFLGTIKKWNDPALCRLNPRLLLPDLDIRVVHQSDESSMDDFFPAFLARQNPKWTLKREKDKNLHWPVGQNVNGNLKIWAKMRQWAGVIAVVNASFAQEKHLPVAQIKNKAGRYVEPSLENIEAAASESEPSTDKEVTLLSESADKKAYPLSTMVWALVDQDYAKIHPNHEKGKALVNFLNWILSADGQTAASAVFYIPLPEKRMAEQQLRIRLIQY